MASPHPFESSPPTASQPNIQAQSQSPHRQRYISQLYVIPAVDAVEAGKGQLEISVNQGQVPNNVQMQDAGRCLVTFIPQHSGTYVIDVTFNGQQVHGCPIKVDVHTKQVGKPVSAPVYSQSTGGVAVGGMSPPPGRGSSAMERGPSSSAYFSGSPHIDTTYSSLSYGASPSPYAADSAPRSPPLVSHVQQRSIEATTSQSTRTEAASAGVEHLKSPRLVQSIGGQFQGPQAAASADANVGYTVAQYGAGETSLRHYATPEKHQSSFFPTTTAHKYFEKEAHNRERSHSPRVHHMAQQHQQGDKSSFLPESQTAQFEMTRSAELTLIRSPPVEKAQSPEDVRNILDSGKTYKRFESVGGDLPLAEKRTKRFGDDDNDFDEGHRYALPQSQPHQYHHPASPHHQHLKQGERPLSRHIYDEIPAHVILDETHRSHDLPFTPLQSHTKRTADLMRVQDTGDHGATPHAGDKNGVEYTHVVEPYSSDIEAMTPGTRRRLLEHSVFKAADLKESDRHISESMNPERIGEQHSIEEHEVRSEPGSKHSSKPTTPRLSLKFGRDKSGGSGKDLSSTGRGFDFGKSKITSKNEVVRRGKDVEVKVDSLKLSKEDQLKVVVMAPARKGQAGSDPVVPPEVPHKVKKSGKTYEISFRPVEVGTHKVLIFVNNQFPHPQTPFPIRVYDAAEIIVGEIVQESVVNDTVEFTVDAGRAGFGNLEMAIKDSDQCIIPSHVSQLEAGTAKFLVTFNPTSLGIHTVNITFNKEIIKGSPFEVNVVENLSGIGAGGSIGDSSTLESKKKDKTKDKKEKKKDRSSANGLSTKSASSSKKESTHEVKSLVVSKIPSLSRVGRPAELTFTLPSHVANYIDARVFDCDKESVPFEIMDDSEPNAKCIQFVPLKVGDHEIEVRMGDVEVNGSPFTCRAYDPTRIIVSNIPDGFVNKAVHFTVDASAAGVGNLEVAVNEGKIPSMAHALGQHKYDISFVPRESVDHFVSVRFNNEPVPGSPFLCRLVASPLKFSASGPGLERIPIEQPVEFWINVPDSVDDDTKAIHAPEVEIIDPRGEILPVSVTPDAQEANRFMVVYTPICVGNHQLEIRYDGEPIAGSPFTSKAFDANSAKLILAEDSAEVGRPSTFTIDAAKAGAGNMEIIVSVGKRNVPNFVTAEGQAKFKVSFTPQEASDHIISVKFNGIPIPGSPMRCPVGAPGFAFSPRAATSPPPQLQQHERDDVAMKQHRTQEMDGGAFSPRQAAGDESPTELRLVGDLASAQVGRPKRFSIDAPKTRTGPPPTECNVIVSGPNHQQIPVKVIRANGGFDVEFLPIVPGSYWIEIQLNGKLLEICPFVCKAVKFPSSSNLSETPFGEHEIDASELRYEEELDGEEEFSTEQPTSSKFSACDVRISRFPRRALVEHLTEFQLEIVRGAEKGLHVDVLDSHGQSLTVNLQRVNCEEQCDEKGLWRQLFVAQWEPLKEGRHEVRLHLDGEILAPDDVLSGSTVSSPFLVRPKSKSFIDAVSHLYVDVLDLSAVHVIGLRDDGICDTPHEFQLDWSKSGGSSLRVELRHENGQSVRCVTRELRRGVTECSFVPPLAGLYLIDIYVDDLRLPECPYECEVMGRTDSGATKDMARAQGAALRSAQRGRTASFEVNFQGASKYGGDLDVVISDSRKGPLPVRCFKQHDGSYLVEFTAEQCGTHKIEITFADTPVAGSPFHCEVVDPERVTIRGIDEPLVVRTIANIIVNRVNAGMGDLSLELSDPQGKPLKLNKVKTSNGEDTFTFLPSKLGAYKLNAKLAGFPLPGMPKTLIVEEPSRPCVYGAAIDYAVVVGQNASLIFDGKRLKGGLKIEVRDEDGQRKIRHTTDKRPDGTTEIAFRPPRVGLYSVGVEFNNRAVIGSPYKVAVVDPEKIILRSENLHEDGILHLRSGEPAAIDVDASTAGPGSLRVEIRDSSTKPNPARPGEIPGAFTDDFVIRVHDLGLSGKNRVELQPKSRTPSRQFKLYFYWAEMVVPSAYPLLAIVDGGGGELSPTVLTTHPTTPKPARTFKALERHSNTSDVQNGDAELLAEATIYRVRMEGDGLEEAILKEQAEFFVDASESPAKLSAHQFSGQLIGDRADIPVRISQVPSKPNVFKCNYTPLVPGRYELSVLFIGEHVPGSPKVVDVKGYTSIAELIKVDTKSLKIGIIGEDVKTVIDARQAKAGHLSAQCVGPSQLEYCELFDNRDGTYVLRITPKELGKHTLTIKYANENVPGSPFTFNVSNPPDPSQVRVYGPGIEHGILHSYKSNFVVETKGAGAGQLTVRVRGPKGAFNVEMQRDRQQDRTIHCKYEPREPGDYQVEVKWHGQHVPGSPFLVIIVDTEEELQRFLSGGAPSPQPTTPFVPPGWLGGLPPIPPGAGRGPGPMGPPPFMMGPPPPHHIMPPPPPHLIAQGPPHHMPHHPHHSPHHQHQIYGTSRPSPRSHRY